MDWDQVEKLIRTEEDPGEFKVGGRPRRSPLRTERRMVWLTIEQVIELGMPRPTLYRRLSSLATRDGERSANGRAKKEIALESLPVAIQQRWIAQSAERMAQSAENATPPPSSRVEDERRESVAAPTSLAAAAEVSEVVEDPPNRPSFDTSAALSTIDEAELAEINQLAEALRQAEGAPTMRRAWVAKKLGIAAATFERKLRAFKKHGITGLIRKTRADKDKPRVADHKVLARIQAAYLRPYKPTIMEVHRAIAKDYDLSGLPAPSYSFVRRTIESIAPDLIARFRSGEKTFDDKFAYVSLRQKPPAPREWVDMDHHPCDHQVVFPDGEIGRPWLTAAQDLCTNEIVAFYLTREKPVGKGSYPGSDAIALTLRQALLKKADPAAWPSYGLFKTLYVDLGRDFRSQHIRAVCSDLGIDIVHTRGYHGKSKPIERWFGVMENALRSLPGYVGNKPEENPERQKLKPEPIDPKKLLSIYEYEAALQKWIVAEFHHRESQALKNLSPLEALEAHVKQGFSAREVRDERVLDLLLMRRGNRLVRNLGIEAFSTRGHQRFFMAPELLALIGQRVDIAWDPAHLGEILVYKDSRFICKAQNKELLEFGASEETLERERELKRQQKKQIDERYQQLVDASQYPNELARAAAEERYERVLDQERNKLAAGAEADGVPVLMPKFARAAKSLRAVQGFKGSRVQGSKSEPQPEPEKNPWLTEDPLPTAEEIFKREKNPWLDEDEE